MNDALNGAIETLKEKISDGGGLGGASVRFDIRGEGSIVVDGEEVSVSEADADCVISAGIDTFREMFDGELNPTSAFMTGRLKIDGDMGIAMKLAQIFA